MGLYTVHYFKHMHIQDTTFFLVKCKISVFHIFFLNFILAQSEVVLALSKLKFNAVLNVKYTDIKLFASHCLQHIIKNTAMQYAAIFFRCKKMKIFS